MAGRAVGKEQLAAAHDGRVAGLVVGHAVLDAFGDLLVEGVLVLRRDRRAGAQRGDVRRERLDLVVGVELVLDRGLLAGLGHRHAAGADLEVDGGGADTHERRAELAGLAGHALAVGAVAEGAAHEEELTALRDLGLVGGALLLGVGRSEGGVQGAGEEQPEEHHQEPGDGAPAVP